MPFRWLKCYLIIVEFILKSSVCENFVFTHKKKITTLFFGTLPPAPGGGYEGVHHTPSVIWFRAYSSTNLCMAFVSTGIRTPALVVRSQSSIHWATPQLASIRLKKHSFKKRFFVSMTITKTFDEQAKIIWSLLQTFSPCFWLTVTAEIVNSWIF